MTPETSDSSHTPAGSEVGLPTPYPDPSASFQLTVRGLMIAIGMFGVCLAAFRLHIAIGSFLSGMLGLATIRTSVKLGRLQSQGKEIGFLNRLDVFARSCIVSATLLAASAIPGICLLPGCFTSTSAHRHLDYANTPISWLKLLLLAMLGVPISVLLRRRIW